MKMTDKHQPAEPQNADNTLVDVGETHPAPTNDNSPSTSSTPDSASKDNPTDQPTNEPTKKPKKAKAAPKDGRIEVYTIMDANKKRVHPRFAKGKYTNIRLVSMYSILVMFLIMPWLRWDNHQAILFNVVEPKFYVFGATFMPQDFYFFAFVFMIAAIALFMVTVYAGRVWCGYVCPQTIYVHLYQYTEKLIIGERNKRIKFDKEPMSAAKAGKLFVLHSLWLIYSVITAFTFVALVAGTDALLHNGADIFFMGWSKLTWIFMGIITFVTYINASYMREHMCVHICPYGRFQSVMFDKDTLIVSYDYHRGEPRGARKKGQDETGYGDCVDCTMCVQVCPTGIDIRNGLQVECIQCAACIDACNEIMDKVEKPRGLIRYTTERQLLENQKTKILSWRIFAYIFVLTSLIVVAGLVLVGRNPLEMDIRHDRKQLGIERHGKIENSYVLKIVNKTDEKHTYKVRLEPIEGIELKSRFDKMPLAGGEVYDWPVSLVADADKVSQGRTPITITVYSEDGQYSMSSSDFFVVE